MALMPVSDALAAVLAGAEPLPDEMIALADAFHRVLARDVAARRTQPPRGDVGDGRIRRARGRCGGKVDAQLTVIGEVAAGRPFAGIGRRRRSGADLHRRRGSRRRRRGRDPGGHGRRTASASRSGKPPLPDGTSAPPASISARATCCCKTGTRLTERGLALAAGMNHPRASRPPPPEGRDPRHRRRAGDAGHRARPRPDRLFQRLRPARARPRRGRRHHRPRHCRRHRWQATTAGIRRARESGADLLITTGGASVGDHDLVKPALDAEGIAMAFWKIAMRPGKPMMHGRLGAMRVIGLPGNPVSSYVCAFLFMVPLIRALSGAASDSSPPRARRARPRRRRERRARGLSSRATLETREDGTLVATARQSPGLLAACESCCGTGTSRARAVRAEGRGRHRLARCCACRSERIDRTRSAEAVRAFTLN